MLNLTLNSRKDNENFDRRRRFGTSRSSDIWSLGCLFYELMTGQFLFYDADWVKFYTRVTKDPELLTADNRARLDNNPFLLEFMSSLLIRNYLHRPTIEHVLAKFEGLHARLTGARAEDLAILASLLPDEAPGAKKGSKELLKDIDRGLAELSRRVGDSVPVELLESGLSHNEGLTPPYTLLLEQFAICSRAFFSSNGAKLVSKGFTHVVSVSGLVPASQLQRHRRLLIRGESISSSTDVLRLVPRVFDFIREVYQFKGKLLVVEDRSAPSRLYLHSVLLREALLYALACLFKCSVYEMWMLVNNQVLSR